MKANFEKWIDDKYSKMDVSFGNELDEINQFATDFAEKEKKENTIDFLIHMLKKYEGHDIIERWQMDDEYDYWTNQKFKEDES